MGTTSVLPQQQVDPDQAAGQKKAQDILTQLGLHPSQLGAQNHLSNLFQNIASNGTKPPNPIGGIAPGSAPMTGVSTPPPDNTITTSSQPTPIASPTGSSTPSPAPELKARPPVHPFGSSPPVSADLIRKNTEDGIAKAQKEYERVHDSGSGISQIHNPFLRDLAKVGDVAYTGLLPGFAMATPGTELHHDLILRGEQGRIAKGLSELKEESGVDKNNADINLINKGTLPEAEARTDLIKAQTVRAGIKPTPTIKYSTAGLAEYADDGQGHQFTPGDPNTPPDIQKLFDVAKANYDTNLNKTLKPLSADQAKTNNSIWDPILKKNNLPTGQFKEGMSETVTQDQIKSFNDILSRTNQAQANTIKARQPALAHPFYVPDKDPKNPGGTVAVSGGVGSHLPAGAQTASGLNAVNTPTAPTRSQQESAKVVEPMLQRTKTQVKALAQSIGPLVGRWNELMVNKGGLDHPEFANLDTQLDLLASAVVRAHFGARGGQDYRKELRKQFSEAQSPDDLIARIDGADAWVSQYAHPHNAAGGPLNTNNNSSGGSGNQQRTATREQIQAIATKYKMSYGEAEKDFINQGGVVK